MLPRFAVLLPPRSPIEGLEGPLDVQTLPEGLLQSVRVKNNGQESLNIIITVQSIIVKLCIFLGVPEMQVWFGLLARGGGVLLPGGHHPPQGGPLQGIHLHTQKNTL